MSQTQTESGFFSLHSALNPDQNFRNKKKKFIQLTFILCYAYVITIE